LVWRATECRSLVDLPFPMPGARRQAPPPPSSNGNLAQVTRQTDPVVELRSVLNATHAKYPTQPTNQRRTS
jgi:hypothetical protein